MVVAACSRRCLGCCASAGALRFAVFESLQAIQDILNVLLDHFSPLLHVGDTVPQFLHALEGLREVLLCDDLRGGQGVGASLFHL
jgi:hypothetical protein